MNLIDTHTHIYLEQFDEDRIDVISRAQENGIQKMLLPNVDLSTIEPMHQLVKDYPGVCYSMMGLHPCSVEENYLDVLAQMKTYLDNANTYIAVGEIGLDLYWEKKFINQQIDALKVQIEWSKEFKIPFVIHVRDAFDELFDTLDSIDLTGTKGIFHCFTGNASQAEKALSYTDFLLGVGGVVTYKKTDLREVLEAVPLNRIVLETDAPYLSPVPKRGKRNEPAFMSYVAEKLVDVKKTGFEEICKQTTQNAIDFFKL